MKFIRDTWLIFLRSLITALRNPVWVILGLFQPICFLLLFGPLFNGIAAAPGFPRGGALTVFTPGVLVMLGMFGTAFVGYGLIADLRFGVVERMRVTPVNRLALLLGRVLRDVFTLLIQSILLLLVAWLLGLRANLAGVVMALILIVMMGFLLASCSYALALTFKNENALASTLNFFTFPLLLLAGVYLPLTFAPDWIRNLAAFDPFSYAVSATRALFSGNMSDSSILLGFAIIGVLSVLTVFWATKSFREALA